MLLMTFQFFWTNFICLIDRTLEITITWAFLFFIAAMEIPRDKFWTYDLGKFPFHPGACLCQQTLNRYDRIPPASQSFYNISRIFAHFTVCDNCFPGQFVQHHKSQSLEVHQPCNTPVVQIEPGPIPTTTSTQHRSNARAPSAVTIFPAINVRSENAHESQQFFRSTPECPKVSTITGISPLLQIRLARLYQK